MLVWQQNLKPVAGAVASAALPAAEDSFMDPEVLDLDDVTTVFVTSAGAVRHLVSEAVAAQTCSIGLLQADASSRSQTFSTCRPLTKLQEQKIRKMKGVAKRASISVRLSCGQGSSSFVNQCCHI